MPADRNYRYDKEYLGEFISIAKEYTDIVKTYYEGKQISGFIESDGDIFYKDYQKDIKTWHEDDKEKIESFNNLIKIDNNIKILKKLLTKIHSALELKENCSLEYCNQVDKNLIVEIEKTFEELE